jgi:hypothetical protein
MDHIKKEQRLAEAEKNRLRKIAEETKKKNTRSGERKKVQIQ